MTERPLKVVSAQSPTLVRGCVVELHHWDADGNAVVKLPGQGGESYRVAADHVQDAPR